MSWLGWHDLVSFDRRAPLLLGLRKVGSGVKKITKEILRHDHFCSVAIVIESSWRRHISNWFADISTSPAQVRYFKDDKSANDWLANQHQPVHNISLSGSLERSLDKKA